jgi:hypothetical protein
MSTLRIYGVNLNETDEPYFEKEEFMQLAEEQGYVWTIEGFEDEFNSGFMDTENLVIKFIELEKIEI